MRTFEQKKKLKLERISSILDPRKKFNKSSNYFNFLSENLRSEYNLSVTENVSSHGYDEFAEELINNNPDGLILDCGCGKRPEYLENVVNFEIVPYETTDVIGLSEHLPFLNDSFDAVFSLNVMEHVRDPFLCANEISRVLKPGGKLYCVVPFLQPYHEYPDHYYNMTHSGLANLFKGHLSIDKQEVISSGLPIWTLTWILSTWAQGLEGETKESFLNMKVSDLLDEAVGYLGMPFVKNLSNEKNFELASTTAIWATKTDS